jgi:hypothetical protein
MDQGKLTLAQSPSQQTVRFGRLLAGIHARNIGINRAAGNQRQEVGHPTRPHVRLAIGVEHAKPGPTQAFGSQLSSAELWPALRPPQSSPACQWFSPLLFPLHEAPAVYGVQEHEVKSNITAPAWKRRLTPAARWGMMPNGVLRYPASGKQRRSLCQSQKRP